MSVDRNRFNLQDIEESCLHESAKSFIENVRAISFALQPAKTFDDITGMQPSEAAHSYAVKVVNRSCCDDDLHRDSSIHRLIRRRRRLDFHIVITTRLVICL